MNTNIALAFLLLAAAPISAQGDGPAPSPSQKTAEQKLLDPFVGIWKTTATIAAMPGVPGMEEAQTTEGIERIALACHGTWLVSLGESSFGGQPAAGMWMLGWDPFAKAFAGVAVSSMPGSTCMLEGRYDEESKKWHFTGDTPMGPFRSEYVWDGADRSVETMFGPGPDGKEIESMRIVRTRLKKEPKASETDEASSTDEEQPSPTERFLHSERGSWDADFQMVMNGVPPMTSKCKEVVEPICFGKWNWSTFTGTLMGMPMEGHALTGYDAESGEVVAFWVDSMSPGIMQTRGRLDPEASMYDLRGTCYDDKGLLDKVAYSLAMDGANKRTMRIVFGAGDGHSTLTIKYTRKKADKKTDRK